MFQRFFQRFTKKARQVVTGAQLEARALNHNYIGTEHVLLGLLDVPDSVAVRALESLKIEPAKIREQVCDIIGKGMQKSPGHIPFTPRAKKVLELSLREALQMGHNYIGTEHILIALLREGEGVAAHVLVSAGMDIARARAAVIRELQDYQVKETGTEGAPARTRLTRPQAVAAFGPIVEGLYDGPSCQQCHAPLSETLASRLIEVEVDEYAGLIRARTLFVYCKACGNTIDSVIVPEEE